jgi:hypothetical protein
LPCASCQHKIDGIGAGLALGALVLHAVLVGGLGRAADASFATAAVKVGLQLLQSLPYYRSLEFIAVSSRVPVKESQQYSRHGTEWGRTSKKLPGRSRNKGSLVHRSQNERYGPLRQLPYTTSINVADQFTPPSPPAHRTCLHGGPCRAPQVFSMKQSFRRDTTYQLTTR